MAPTFREFFEGLASAGFTRERAHEEGMRRGFDSYADDPLRAVGSPAPGPQPLPLPPQPRVGLAQPLPPDPAPPSGVTTLRSLQPGMPTVAQITESGGILPVEQITFTEEEADFGRPLAPPQPEPSFADPPPRPAPVVREMSIEELRAKAPSQAMKTDLSPEASFRTPPPTPVDERTAQLDADVLSSAQRQTARFPSPEEQAAAKAERDAEAEAAQAVTDAALTGDISYPPQRFEQRDRQPPAPEEPGAMDKIVARAVAGLIRDRKPVTIESIALASVGAGAEEVVGYMADTVATIAGVAVGAAEPIAAGALGVGAALGIPGIEGPYNAAVTRMERTMFDLGKFYESKLNDGVISNARSGLSEIPSGMFHLGEGLLGGAITAEELAAASPFERAKIGYMLGRELGSQLTEGALVAFVKVFSDPVTSARADPIGTLLTIQPLLKAAKTAGLSTPFTVKAGAAYDLLVDHLSRNDSFSATMLVEAKQLRAKVDRAVADAGSSIEGLEASLYESTFREPRIQTETVRSISGQFGREIEAATVRGEISVPSRVGPKAPKRPERGEPKVESRSAKEGADDTPPGDMFRPDEAAAEYIPLSREFEVFEAGIDADAGVVVLKRARTEAELRGIIEKREIKKGATPERAKSAAKKKARDAAERGVAGYRDVNLARSRSRLMATISSDVARLVNELGGGRILAKKGKRPTSGLVDIDGEEFLVAMAEAVDIEAANILSSKTLRSGLATAVKREYADALGRKLSRAEADSIETVIHDAASRMPKAAGDLGSAKTYDVLFDVPGRKTPLSMLEVARDVITDNRTLSGRVFKESIIAAGERIAHKAQQRRRQRGWVEALGGKDRLKRSSKLDAAGEAKELADSWAASRAAGTEPSLPAAFTNDPKAILAEINKLGAADKAALDQNFLARFKPGNAGTTSGTYRRLTEEMLQHVGLVEMSPQMQSAKRVVRIDAPFKSASDMKAVWVPNHVYDTVDLIMKEEAWRMNRGPMAQFERTAKANQVARNASSLVNAAVANVMYQSVRRGDPLVLAKMIKGVVDYKRWKAGKLTDPEMIRMFEAIDRTGAITSSFVDSELNKAYGLGESGGIMKALGETAAGKAVAKTPGARATGRFIEGLSDLQEAAFSWTDNGAKLEDAIHNWGRLNKHMETVKAGEWIQAPVGPKKVSRIYKDSGGRWRLDKPDGRVLSDAQLAQVRGRMAVQPGLRAFFDYGDVGKAANLARTGGRGSGLVMAAVNPYWTWSNKAMTFPGVQGGLAAEVLKPGMQIVTNSKALRMQLALETASAGFRRAALVQGARNTLGDREFHEGVRNAAQFETGRHAGMVGTFSTLADPQFIAVKNWTNASFLEPFDNLLGVVDSLVNGPASPSANKASDAPLPDGADVWSGYDDMTALFGSLDPNNIHDLNAVFPDLMPTERSAKSLKTAQNNADDRSLAGVPSERRQEVKRIRTLVRDAWSGRKSAIASAIELAGFTGGLFQRSITLGAEIAEQKGVQARTIRRFNDSLGPLMMGGTVYKTVHRGVGPVVFGDTLGGGWGWQYLPPGADYSSQIQQAFTLVTTLGKVHMRAIGKPDSTLGERAGILSKDISDLKTAMRSSFGGLGEEIILMNVKLKQYDDAIEHKKVPNMTEDDYTIKSMQRATALDVWKKIMGSKAPGEKGKSKGGLINLIAQQHEDYITEGWSRAPAKLMAPGQRKPGYPAHSLFDLF